MNAPALSLPSTIAAALLATLAGCAAPEGGSTDQAVAARTERTCVTGSNICRGNAGAGSNVISVSGDELRKTGNLGTRPATGGVND